MLVIEGLAVMIVTMIMIGGHLIINDNNYRCQLISASSSDTLTIDQLQPLREKDNFQWSE